MFTDDRHKFGGTATVGSKGQIVIPSEVRKKLKLKEKDKLLVYTVHDRIMGIIKAEDIDELMTMLNNKFSKINEEIDKGRKA